VGEVMRKGISLIVLVITIIVIIILAGSVILSLSNNNPINNATQAAFKSNIQTYNSDLSINISNLYTNNTLFDSKELNATSWNGNPSNILGTVKQYIPSIKVADASKFVIYRGQLVYIGNDVNQKNWSEETLSNYPIVKSNLIWWLDGTDFLNDPQTTTWIDRSGNSYDFKVKNFSYTNLSGKNEIDKQVVFDGVDDYASTTSNLETIGNFTSGEYTLEFAIKKGQVLNSADNLTFGETIVATSGMSPYFMWVVVKNNEIGIATYKTSISFNFTTGANITQGNEYIVQIVVKKGMESKIYINGILNTTFIAGNDNFSSIGYVTLADLRNDRNIRFAGNINFMRMYNRVLSEQEILFNYNASK
jgi:hypothetical protein